MPYHLATSPYLGVGFHSCWSGRRGSNSLPPPWQGGALPDELRPHIRCIFPCTLPSDSCEFRGPRESLRSKILWGRGGISKFVTAVLLVRLPDKRLTFRRATRIGLEPTTPSVTGWCSNQLSYRAILEQLLLLRNGAADEARTRYLHLGKVALYQMSYGRIFGAFVPAPTRAILANFGAPAKICEAKFCGEEEEFQV